MKLFILIILFGVLASCNIGANKPHNVKIQYSNIGYNQLSLFVYNVVQKDSLDSLISYDTLGLFCSSYIDYDSRYTSQWAFLTKNDSGYQLIANKYSRDITGSIMNDTELFIHPARECYVILQFCPYPIFYNNKTIGDTWQWSFNIGGPLWANATYPIKEPTNFTTIYTYKDTATLNTKLGSLFCYHIIATSTSSFGKSYASYYFNDSFGMVNFEIKTLDKRTFKFDLINVLHNEDSIKFNKDFMWETRPANILKL